MNSFCLMVRSLSVHDFVAVKKIVEKTADICMLTVTVRCLQKYFHIVFNKF